MTGNVRVLPAPVTVLWEAVSAWEDADIRLRSGECDPNDCLCKWRDDPDHECLRCVACGHLLMDRADEVRSEVVAAVVAAGLAGDVAEAAGAA